MIDDLFIDEQGRFQAPSEELVTLVELLREHKVLCSVEESEAFTTEGHSFGYGRIHNMYDVEAAADLCHKWRIYQRECHSSPTT